MEHTCEFCSLIEGYAEQVSQAESFDELKAMIEEIFQNGFSNGYEAAIIDDVNEKIALLEGNDEQECDCGYCH